MSYRCDTCNYETTKPFNYDRHLKSKRHLLNETAQNANIETTHKQIETAHKQNETAHKSYENYKTVQTAQNVIEPEPEEDERFNTDLQIIGNTVEKVNKASSDAIKKYKPKEETENSEAKHSNSLAIALIAIFATGVIIWIFFKDKIMEILGIDGNAGSLQSLKLNSLCQVI